MPTNAASKGHSLAAVDKGRLLRRTLFGLAIAFTVGVVLEEQVRLLGRPGFALLLFLPPTVGLGYWCLRKEAPGRRLALVTTILIGAFAALALFYAIADPPPGSTTNSGRVVVSVGLALLTSLLWLFVFGPRPSGVGIARPDVLGAKANTEGLARVLAPTEHGVFCGELDVDDTRESLYVSAEDRGVVIGPPGTGKTAFMLTQLLDWSERRGAFVCLDIKPELHAILRPVLEREGYRVLVVNPTAPEHRYNLLDDLAGSTTAVGELAAALVPDSDGQGRAFDEGARDILDAIISFLRADGQPPSLPAIREFLAALPSERELIRTLGTSPDADVREIAFALSRSAANARFMGSVFATLRANLRFLRHETIRECVGVSDFSLELFLGERPVALFLQFEERHQQTTRLLLAALVSHLFNWFIEHTDRNPVLLMLDEIGNVPRIPGLVEKLNTIRSRRLPTWLYWQGLQQMLKYGLKAGEGPSSIMAACDFQMAFRLNDNDTARWFSERLGTVDRTVTSVSGADVGVLGALLDERTPRDTRTTGVVEEPIMKVADLQSLAFGESVAAYRGRVWRNRATPYFRRWPAMARS